MLALVVSISSSTIISVAAGTFEQIITSLQSISALSADFNFGSPTAGQSADLDTALDLLRNVTSKNLGAPMSPALATRFVTTLAQLLSMNVVNGLTASVGTAQNGRAALASQMQRVDRTFRATLSELRTAILGPLESGEPSVMLTGPTPNVSLGVQPNSTMTVVLRRMAAHDFAGAKVPLAPPRVDAPSAASPQQVRSDEAYLEHSLLSNLASGSLVNSVTYLSINSCWSRILLLDLALQLLHL